MLDDLARRRPHVRSAEIEQILAQGADVARAPSDAFTALDNADLTFGRVRDETGKEIELTKARHALLLRSKDRRRVAAPPKPSPGPISTTATRWRRCTALRSAATSFRPGCATTLRPGKRPLRGQRAGRGLRQPDASVRAARPVLARYLELRRRVLGLDHSRPMISWFPCHLSRSSATTTARRRLVLGGLGLLGERYVADLRAGFARRWVDVHETKGKRSGAYSSGPMARRPSS